MAEPTRPRTRGERNAQFLAQPTANLAEQDARRIFRESKSDDPRESLAEIARQLGHLGGRVDLTVAGTRYFSWCSCGFVSTTRNTESDAAGALVHHLRLAMREWRLTGLPLSAMPPRKNTDWKRVRRRAPHLDAWLKYHRDSVPEVAQSSLPTINTPRRAVS
jgi:hypothetical protein